MYNLCTRRKVTTAKLSACFWSLSSLTMLGLLFCECPDFPLIMFIISINSSYGSVAKLTLKLSRIMSRTIFIILSIYIYSIALTPTMCILSLMVFQIWCHSFTNNVPLWVPTILILLSNDIHLNPGPHFENNFFNFMSWNLNSLAKDNFQRIRLIEAHNALFKYDLISINDYTFVPANNPANVRHGGVGLFFKNSLPVIVRDDLSFDESIETEIKFGRKILKNYIQKLDVTTLLQDFILVILMHTLSYGSMMVIQTLRVWKLKIFLIRCSNHFWAN